MKDELWIFVLMLMAIGGILGFAVGMGSALVKVLLG